MTVILQAMLCRLCSTHICT